MQIRVYYEDTDAGGVVYHSNYLNFCERARSELFFQRGMTPHYRENEFFVVKSLQADFIKSARLGDMLDIKTSILEIKKASMQMAQEIYKDDVLLFKAVLTVAFIKNQKPSRIPQEILNVFK